MRIKPIIFSTPMVQAILEGRKTMTRRVIVPQPDCPYVGVDHWHDAPKGSDTLGPIRRIPYAPGDTLWVREKWRTVDYEYCDGKWSAAIERADGTRDMRVRWYDNSDVGIPDDSPYSKTGWRPSIHMPKEAARIFLRVTGVRVEKLQKMPLFDVWDEGTPQLTGYRDAEGSVNHNDFRILWDGLNAKRGYGWDTNPWVWVYSFERVDKSAGWPGGEK